jgi:hypothetical protein
MRICPICKVTPMNVDLTEINMAGLNPHTLLVVRLPKDEIVPDAIESIARSFRATKRHETNHLLILPEDYKIEELPEEQMNKAGWYRLNFGMDLAKGPDETVETKVEEKQS